MSDDIGTTGDDESQDAGGGPPPVPRPPRAPASSRPTRRSDGVFSTVEPLTALELSRSLVRPDLMAAHVLGSSDRMAQNLAAGENLGPLTAVLAVASLVASAPFGALSPFASAWKVAALFTGSLLICLPCLHVVLQFVGIRIDVVRNLSLALVITATAGLFTFGFFPIIWFIDLTTRAGEASVVAPVDLARLLLSASLLMGIVQMRRCLASGRWSEHQAGGMTAIVFLWLPLLLFIVWRMAAVLGMRG